MVKKHPVIVPQFPSRLRGLAFCTLLLFGLASLELRPHAQARTAKEEDYYRISNIPIPDGLILEAGALQFMPGGRLAISTRLGEIFIAEGVLDQDLSKVRFTKFAAGLHEVLGLAEKDGWLYCTQRGEVTRMKDLDGDGAADRFETVSDAWGLTGDYHEYAFGSKFDRDGNIWVALCLTGSFTSDAEYRGWCLRITPDGKAIPTCSGLRSPGGIGTNHLGDMFFTDNQGPWNGACSLKHLYPGDFMGNPSGNGWYKLSSVMGERPPDPESGSRMQIEASKNRKLRPPAVYFPYQKMGQSASGIACDQTGGKFGPFGSQLFVGDQTHSTVMRVALEAVKGRYQGACFMVREGFASGNLALEFAPDGSLFVYGTDRGWGARGGKPFALQRMVWTGQSPFEIQQMLAKSDGFELVFTEPVDPRSVARLESYLMESYAYIYQSRYGSPEVDQSRPKITSAKLSEDGRRVRLVLDQLVPGKVYELHLVDYVSATGLPLLHTAAYYTLNNIPEE